MEIRTKFYELLSHCIPPTVILKVRPFASTYTIYLTGPKTVAEAVVSQVDETLKAEIIHWAAFYVGTNVFS